MKFTYWDLSPSLHYDLEQLCKKYNCLEAKEEFTNLMLEVMEKSGLCSEEDFNERVEDELERRIDSIRGDGYDDGYEDGKREAEDDIIREAMDRMEVIKLSEHNKMIKEKYDSGWINGYNYGSDWLTPPDEYKDLVK